MPTWCVPPARPHRAGYPQILGIAQHVECAGGHGRDTVALMTDIPTLRRLHEMPPIRNAEDLYLHWRALMGPLGFGQPRLWIAFIQPDDMMAAQLTQIEDIPRRVDSTLCGPLLEMCQHIVGRNGAGGSVAFLLTRPGRNPMDDADRSWGRGLTAAADYLGVSIWPVHFANDVELRVFAPDDLVLRE